MSEVTRLFAAIQHGDLRAGDELLPLVYQELRQLARAKMAREQPGHTLQPTALVHEAWLRLGCGSAEGEQRFESRAHFFGAAAEAMRRILIDRARSRASARRGGDLVRVEADEFEIAGPAADEELFAVHEALNALGLEDPEKAEVVKLRYFVGLTFEQTADVLGISERTVRRHWAYARAWLFAEIKDLR
jgi:RNA polymerase sigma factor (TIGR02999 family)